MASYTAQKLTVQGAKNALDIYRSKQNQIVIKKNYKRSKSKYTISYYPNSTYNRNVLAKVYGTSLVSRWLQKAK